MGVSLILSAGADFGKASHIYADGSSFSPLGETGEGLKSRHASKKYRHESKVTKAKLQRDPLRLRHLPQIRQYKVLIII